MEQKIIEINTIEDVLKVVNKDNLNDFIIDFKSFLEFRLNFEDMNFLKILKPKDNIFRWINDGEHKATINIEVQLENGKEE